MKKTKTLKIDPSSSAIIYAIFALMAGLILPLILIPIVDVTHYSEIIEEIAKMLVVLFIIMKLPTTQFKIFGGMLFGMLFGLSENFLYLNQIFQSGEINIFWQRFIFTLPMHIITVLIILFSGLAGKKYIIFGSIGAIILHILFNSYMIQTLLIR